MLLELKKISKRFGTVEVLKGINLELQKGSVLGLVGENGAGKSTLMNILGGVFPASSGELFLKGELFEPQKPTDSLKHGIAFIHQELNLFPNLSVQENLYLNSFPTKKIMGIPFIDQKATVSKSKRLLAQVDLEVNIRTLVEDLTPAQRQLLEIAKALATSPEIIIFDEPTTALTRHEAEKLFGLIAQLQKKGIAMIYISHNLEDVTHLSQRIVVLRDGVCASTYERENGFAIPRIIRDMVGRDVAQLFPERNTIPKKSSLLQVEQLSAPPLVNDVSFTLRTGEVLGFYGLVGSGRTEMARIIYGLESSESGAIRFGSDKNFTPSPKKWVKNGLAFLTEDRREEGLLLDHNIEKNIALAALPSYASSIVKRIKYKAVRSATVEKAKATKIKFNSMTRQAVATLSGGNQQKVVLSKWLLTAPKILIMDEPTKGIDVGAKHEIYGLINQLIEKGASVILISSEIEELLGMCNRILVMNRGRVTVEFDKPNFDRHAILAAALHTNSNEIRKEEA